MELVTGQNIVPSLCHFRKEVLFAIHYVKFIVKKHICVKYDWHHLYVVKSSMTNRKCRLCMIMYTLMLSSVQIPSWESYFRNVV